MDEYRMKLMRDSLLSLVELCIIELKPLSAEARMALAKEDSQNIAERADTLFRNSKSKPRVSVLASIARGIAIGAYQPGGITVLGIHACVTGHSDCPAGNELDTEDRHAGCVRLVAE